MFGSFDRMVPPSTATAALPAAIGLQFNKSFNIQSSRPPAVVPVLSLTVADKEDSAPPTLWHDNEMHSAAR
jgi:hypothetical protein